MKIPDTDRVWCYLGMTEEEYERERPWEIYGTSRSAWELALTSSSLESREMLRDEIKQKLQAR